MPVLQSRLPFDSSRKSDAKNNLPCLSARTRIAAVKGSENRAVAPERDVEAEVLDVDLVEIKSRKDAGDSLENGGKAKVEYAQPKTTEDILDNLIKQQRENGYKPGWLLYRIKEFKLPLTLEQWKKVEKACGYGRGWAKHRYNEARYYYDSPTPPAPPAPKSASSTAKTCSNFGRCLEASDRLRRA